MQLELALALAPDYGPCCMYQQKPKHQHHKKIERDSREVEWLNLRPLTAKKAPIKQQGFVSPMNSLQGMDHFIARIEAIQRITDQQKRDAETNKVLIEQDRELPSIIDEFRANGFKAISLSSSQGDDDPADPNPNSIQHVPNLTTAEEIAPLLRRIEWEKIEAQNGPALKVALTKQGDDIGAVAQPWVNKLLGPDGLRTLGKKIKAACADTPFEEIENNRVRASHYNAIGSCLYGVTGGWTAPEQSMDELGADELEEKKPSRGPQEIGLHGTTYDYPVSQLLPDGTLLIGYDQVQPWEPEAQEPGENTYWPLDDNGEPIDATRRDYEELGL